MGKQYLVVGLWTANLLCGLTSLSAAEPSPALPPVNFQRQVRPILSNNCFLCHGPDKGTRMADVRLDIREGAFATRKNGVIVTPGKPDESLLIKRVFSNDAAYRMPPAFSHKSLTAEQKDILRRWIQEGANWKDHWSFIAPVRPPLPAVKDTAWVRTPVDQFVLAKLEANSLTPAPEADRRTLLRRVTLDLTGLPPSPAEADAFLKDKSPKAYEKVVDRLLASPHYGEHMGHYWLDAARYADTQGLHIDNYREMWPYRDWVIQAFNRNLRFDDFTVKQLAGDLLPQANLDDKIASGFERCNVTTNEGGAIPAEVEAMYARDRADTVGTVWMGLTVGCATCHDHKFDPIAQKEMYALTAFFRNTTQYALDGNAPDTPPIIVVPAADDRQKWDDLNALRSRLLQKLSAVKTDQTAAFETWLRSPARLNTPAPLADAQQFALDASSTSPAAKGPVESVPGPNGANTALHFGKEGYLELPNVGAIDANKPFTIATWVKIPKANASFPIASQLESQPGKDGEDPKDWGWNVSIQSNNTEPSLPFISLAQPDGQYLTATPSPLYGLKAATWYHIVYTYDGSGSRQGLQIYINGNVVPSYGDGRDLAPLKSSIRNAAPLRIGRRNKGYFEDGFVAGFRILDKRCDEQDAQLLYSADLIAEASQKNIADLSENERQALLTYYLNYVDPAATPVVAELHKVDAGRFTMARRSATTFVQQERTDTQPEAHVLYRGLYDQPRDEVHPNVPAVLPPMPEALPRNRLGLAKWLIDPANPLMARVTVNRFWQQLFGNGLVKTAEDFGSQGEPPSHPELLDWMAVDFRESGWDVKRMMRLFVTSATYRQAAITTSAKLEHDRDNRLLSRGPRFRMDAEMIRDFALAASGLLVEQVGGPSVKPYQPAKIWETVAMNESNTRIYTPGTGDDLYRRSLYTFWKRSAPPASMDIFDAPSREECVVRRERTDTPLQALVTMDDPQFVEAARVLAQNSLHAAKGNVTHGLNYMADRLLTRDLDEKEQAVVLHSYQDYLDYYRAQTADAAKLVNIGASKCDPKLQVPELAAMTMVANELMNLDEVLVK